GRAPVLKSSPAMKVLVVDPNESTRDELRRAFAALGGSVRGFATVAEGEKALVEFDPAIVVAAVDACDDPGAVFARIAEPNRALYALVDARDLDRAVAALASGADDFLWRPVSPARVAQLYGAARLR